MTCSVDKTIEALVETIIKKPVNSDIVVYLIMTNLLSSTQKIKPPGKMLK
ncbi:hypothetical protein Goshw_012442 [Gossypium schwendimanii]|uniref:Uncharacterized protein n=1 Tax=Gossypium schwendimanii TaxID=34291 RepID=A0A7J9KRX7_GOSSC|nr:hypothetical protein [Gossypium schwendimanii]